MRLSGILMPIFSLPSKYGVGTLGKKAYEFVDFLKEAGQSYWQILPINPTNDGNSPYSAVSSFAGNPFFIDLDLLSDDGYLKPDDYSSIDFGEDYSKVDYEKISAAKNSLLKKAYDSFTDTGLYFEEYKAFKDKQAYWLRNYALYMAIRNDNLDKPWYEWDNKYKDFKNSEEYCSNNESKVEYYMFVQFLFYRQWYSLKEYANKNGIRIIGDMPFYVSFDSADAWAEPYQFDLDDDYTPKLVSGCPPDAFSSKGQLWGTPVYNFDYMKKDGYSWWNKRLMFALSVCDVLRIDHFRGFESYYAIKYGEKDATGGKWIKGPGLEFFKQFEKKYGQKLPIIAEDLGYITDDVRQLLDDCGFPGIKVLQFAFSTDCESVYLPHNISKNSVVYTGTHDNDTIMGWHDNGNTSEIDYAKKYMNYHGEEGFNWSFIRLAMSSVADTSILMMPDLLGLDSKARINVPSTVGDNWRWRIGDGCTNSWLAKIIYDMTRLYSRLPK